MRFCANCARPKEYYDEEYCKKCKKELDIPEKMWRNPKRRSLEEAEMRKRLKFIAENDELIQAKLRENK